MDHFGALLPLRLRLLGHGALHRCRQFHILDLDRRHFHAPALRMLVDDRLQVAVDLVALRQEFIQFRLAQHVAQGRLTDLRGRLVEVHHLDHRLNRIDNVEVDYRRHLDRNVISGDHLLRWYRQRDDTQVDFDHARDEWGHQEQPWAFCPDQPPQYEDHAALVLLHHADCRERDDHQKQYECANYNQYQWIHS